MNTRRQMVLAGAALLATAGLAVGVKLASARALVPVPVRQVIVQLSKVVDGQEQVVKDQVLQCPPGHLIRQMQFRVKGQWVPWDCDEGCSKAALNGIFEASIVVRRRETPGTTHRGCFTGRWVLRSATGAAIASGTLKGTVYAGTHNGAGQACEPCAPEFHFEGTLEGQSILPNCPGPICASLQGHGLDPQAAGFTMRVEGALFVPCQGQPGGAANTHAAPCCSG